MSLSAWLLFCLMSLITAFTPGPAVLLAVSNATMLGMRRALISSAGNAAGVLVVSATAMLGLGALLKTSAWSFGAVKAAGAAYLIYLGIRQWRNKAGFLDVAADAATLPTPRRHQQLFLQGLLVAATNPKSILFFTALFPQFMTVDRAAQQQFLGLTLTFAACTMLSHLCYMGLVRSARGWFAGATRIRLFNRLCATLYISLGVGLLRLRHHTA